MGKKKTTSTQQNTYQYYTPPPNPYLQQAASEIDAIDYQTDVHNAYGQAENAVRESGNDFYGSDTPAGLAESIRNTQLFKLKTDKGTALNRARSEENQARIGGHMALGGATAPQLVQSGGTNTKIEPFDWGSLIMGGMQAGGSMGAAMGAAAMG